MIKNKTIIWHKEWIIGFFQTINEVHDFIKRTRAINISKDRLRLFCPDKIKKQTIGGIRREKLHPEWLWVVKGSLTGLLIGGFGGNFFIASEKIALNLPMGISAGLIFGFAGAIVGGLLGLLSSNTDSSLNSYYESHKKKQIMIAIHCPPGDEIGLRRMERLFKKAHADYTSPRKSLIKKANSSGFS